eukprot:11638266-Prorocentrum_lima.AAC.1
MVAGAWKGCGTHQQRWHRRVRGERRMGGVPCTCRQHGGTAAAYCALRRRTSAPTRGKQGLQATCWRLGPG